MKQNSEIRELLQELYTYCKNKLKFNKPAKIFLIQNDKNAEDIFGKTAYYDPKNMHIKIYISNRHPKDVLRSFSHEIIHHYQNCAEKLPCDLDTEEGYAQNDEILRLLEQEAYTKGNMIFRDWEDGKKQKRYFDFNLLSDQPNDGE